MGVPTSPGYMIRLPPIVIIVLFCEVLPHKEDPDRTRITIGGNLIIYPGDEGTPTVSLELIKFILDSVLSRPGDKFACFDVKNFYLVNPMERSEYAPIKIVIG